MESSTNPFTKYVLAPTPYRFNNTGSIIGVYCREDEDIEWAYGYDNSVIGYIIIKKEKI